MILNNLNFTKSSASPQRLKKMKEWLAVEIAYLQHHVCKMNDRIVCRLFSLISKFEKAVLYPRKVLLSRCGLNSGTRVQWSLDP